MKKTILLIVALLLFSTQVLVSQAFALNLDEAKSKGLVGELRTGYLAAVRPSAEVNKLVQNINKKRRAHYQSIAKKNGTPQKTVEELAGKKAIAKTQKGRFIQKQSGKWIKK